MFNVILTYALTPPPPTPKFLITMDCSQLRLVSDHHVYKADPIIIPSVMTPYTSLGFLDTLDQSLGLWLCVDLEFDPQPIGHGNQCEKYE